MRITRRAFLYSLQPSVRAAGPSSATRLLVQIDDVSPSYPRGAAVLSKQQAIVAALGPGDRFTDIELGGPFTPDRVKIQCFMPVAPPLLFETVRRPRDLVANQQRIESIWRRVDEQRKLVAEFLSKPRHIQGPTPLFETLEYVSRQMRTSDVAQKRLVIFSDLVHDNTGRISGYPPAEIHPAFDGITVLALFVPWKSDFHNREGAWRKWFLASGARDFAMLDSAQSQVAPVLAPTSVPRVLRQRF